MNIGLKIAVIKIAKYASFNQHIENKMASKSKVSFTPINSNIFIVDYFDLLNFYFYEHIEVGL
jgi:hypothetical protein